MAKAQDGKARKGKARAKKACDFCKKRKVRCGESCRKRKIQRRKYEETQGVKPADSEAKLLDSFELFPNGMIDPSFGDPPPDNDDASFPEDFITLMCSLDDDNASVLPHGDVDVSKDGKVVDPFPEDVKALMNSLGEFATFAYPSGDFKLFSGKYSPE